MERSYSVLTQSSVIHSIVAISQKWLIYVHFFCSRLLNTRRLLFGARISTRSHSFALCFVDLCLPCHRLLVCNQISHCTAFIGKWLIVYSFVRGFVFHFALHWFKFDMLTCALQQHKISYFAIHILSVHRWKNALKITFNSFNMA